MVDRGVLADFLVSSVNIKSATAQSIKQPTLSEFQRVGFESSPDFYTSNIPKLLFVVEYVVSGEFLGCLLVWKKYLDSTHYEIFKKNIFSKLSGGTQDSEFNRVLFLSVKDLEKERSYYVDYIRQIGDFVINEDDILIFHDPHIKKDRIYQYKIVATKVPQKISEIDYNFILLHKEKAYITEVHPESSELDMYNNSAKIFGDRRHAWVMSLLNDSLRFFSPNSVNVPISNFLVNNEIVMPTDYKASDIMKIIDDSIFLFGVKDTYKQVLSLIGGLPDIFFDIFVESIDPVDRIFYTDKFNSRVANEIIVTKTTISDSEQTVEEFLKAFSFPPVNNITKEQLNLRLQAVIEALENKNATFSDPITKNIIWVPLNIKWKYENGQLQIPDISNKIESVEEYGVPKVDLSDISNTFFTLSDLKGHSGAFEYLRQYLYLLNKPANRDEDVSITFEKKEGETTEADILKKPGTKEGITEV